MDGGVHDGVHQWMDLRVIKLTSLTVGQVKLRKIKWRWSPRWTVESTMESISGWTVESTTENPQNVTEDPKKRTKL